MAPKRDQKKRLGKKHRQASTRPRKGKNAPRVTAVTGAVSPKKRKEIATKKAALAKAKLTPTRSPENERRRTISERTVQEPDRSQGGPREKKLPALRAGRTITNAIENEAV